MRCSSFLIPFVMFVVVSPAAAQVDARIASLSRQLGQGQDPQVRSKAASGLGTSDDPEALPPLCEGLKDPSEEVRAAPAPPPPKPKQPAGPGRPQGAQNPTHT